MPRIVASSIFACAPFDLTEGLVRAVVPLLLSSTAVDPLIIQGQVTAGDFESSENVNLCFTGSRVRKNLSELGEDDHAVRTLPLQDGSAVLLTGNALFSCRRSATLRM